MIRPVHALILVAAAIGVYYAAKLATDDETDLGDLLPDLSGAGDVFGGLFESVSNVVDSVGGFITVGFEGSGAGEVLNYLEGAFDLANSDFRTSLTSGRGNQYASALEVIGRSKGLPDFLLSRIAYQESRFKPDAFNKGSKAAGMFQINPITQLELKRQMGKDFDVYNWKQAAEGSAVYLAYLYRMFGNWTHAVAAYNCGPGTLKKHQAANGGKFVPEKMPQPEQRLYAPQVMADIYQD